MESFAERIARAELLGELLARVGYAFWQLAECEDAVAAYLVTRLKATKGMGQSAGEALMADARRRTFGSLVSELREAGALESSTQDRLDKLVTERNWLAHRAKRESRGIVFDDVAYRNLSLRLESISDEASSVLKLVGDQLLEYVSSKGVDMSAAEREAVRIASSWGYFGGTRTV
jgi:uncharacterized protein YutE (UPF0331/DUF86 family)